MDMKHNDENELVEAYLDARLSPDEHAAVEARLSSDKEFAEKLRLHTALLRLAQRRKTLQLIRQTQGKQGRSDQPTNLTGRSVYLGFITWLQQHLMILVIGGLLVVLIGAVTLPHTATHTAQPNSPHRVVGSRKWKLPQVARPQPQPAVQGDSTKDTIEILRNKVDTVYLHGTRLISQEAAWADTATWRSSINGPSLSQWLALHQVELPRKIDPVTWNRVTAAVHIRLIGSDHSGRWRRLILLGDLDLEEPKYYLGQTLFVFFPYDPRDLDLNELTWIRQGRKSVLQIGTQCFHLREHGLVDSLMPIE